jgi:hypothetical protein
MSSSVDHACHEQVSELPTSVRPVHHEAAVSGLMLMHGMTGISVTALSTAAAAIDAGQWFRNSASAT